MGGLTLTAGQVVWAVLDPALGREQGGRRPCVVVSSRDFSETILDLTVVLPCTTRGRGWDNHVLLTGPTGLKQATFAMTEQPRTVSIQRIRSQAGHVDDTCLQELAFWIDSWLHAA